MGFQSNEKGKLQNFDMKMKKGATALLADS